MRGDASIKPGSARGRGLNRAGDRTAKGSMLMEKPPFDQLCHLAKTDPAAFERLRAELVEDFIKSTPPSHQKRLRGLQFVIDSRRSLAKTPVKAMLDIQAMMHSSLEKLRLALNNRYSGHQLPATDSNVVPLQRHH